MVDDLESRRRFTDGCRLNEFFDFGIQLSRFLSVLIRFRLFWRLSENSPADKLFANAMASGDRDFLSSNDHLQRDACFKGHRRIGS